MTDASFPADIKNCMRECLLSVLWPRKDIFEFLRNGGCTNTDLKEAQHFKESNTSRSQIIDVTFSALAARPDGGLGQFRAMLKALTEWSHFDAYYFDNLKKLDRTAAEQKLSHLRQLVEIRDAKLRDERKRREAAEQRSKQSTITSAQLRDRFLNLYLGKIKPQSRGYELETLLNDMGKKEGLEVTSSFRCTGEQIDGGLKYEGENYLIEAKWHDRSASTEPLYAFAGKIHGKMYGRGLFVSVNGFSPDPVRALVTGKAIQTILVDGEDLTLIVEDQISLTKTLDAKIRAAQLTGEIYIHPLSKKSKIVS